MHLEIIFKDPNRKKIFLSKTKTLCAVILSYHLLTWFTGCPFRFFFGISCPGCGMTRALLAALRLDFAAAFSYQKQGCQCDGVSTAVFCYPTPASGVPV